MVKEVIISIIIVATIFFGDSVTQNYAKSTIEELSYNLGELRQEITAENKEKMKEKVGVVDDDWNRIHDKLAYFIEHDELEKVENGLVSMKSFIETEEYEESINELDKSVFVLKHIEDKNQFNLKNVF